MQVRAPTGNDESLGTLFDAIFCGGAMTTAFGTASVTTARVRVVVAMLTC